LQPADQRQQRDLFAVRRVRDDGNQRLDMIDAGKRAVPRVNPLRPLERRRRMDLVPARRGLFLGTRKASVARIWRRKIGATPDSGAARSPHRVETGSLFTAA
jgi:hypothetical protein